MLDRFLHLEYHQGHLGKKNKINIFFNVKQNLKKIEINKRNLWPLKPSVLNDSIHIVESDQCSVNMWNSVDSSCEIWMHGAQNANSANPAPKQKTKTFLVAIFYPKFS